MRITWMAVVTALCLAASAPAQEAEVSLERMAAHAGEVFGVAVLPGEGSGAGYGLIEKDFAIEAPAALSARLMALGLGLVRVQQGKDEAWVLGAVDHGRTISTMARAQSAEELASPRGIACEFVVCAFPVGPQEVSSALVNAFSRLARSSSERLAATGSSDGVLLFAGYRATATRVAALMETLAAERDRARPRSLLIPLEHADPHQIANSIHALIAGPSGPRAAQQGSLVAPPRLVAHPSRKALIAVGTAGQLVMVRELITKADQPAEAAPPRAVKVVFLQHAKAHRLAATLSTLARGPMSVQVQADERTNSLLIAGTESQIQRLLRLVEHLDVEVDPAGKDG